MIPVDEANVDVTLLNPPYIPVAFAVSCQWLRASCGHGGALFLVIHSDN
jgi:hypothetical protein